MFSISIGYLCSAFKACIYAGSSNQVKSQVMFKQVFFGLGLCVALISCKNQASTQNVKDNAAATTKSEHAGKQFGAAITADGAISYDEMLAKMGTSDSLAVKVTGKVGEVCQAKGCWMTMDLGNGEIMRIKFKDYGFFVPKDAAGKTATIEGVAKKEKVDIDELKHLAEDAGKSEAEINAINQAKEELTFVADGVIIK